MNAYLKKALACTALACLLLVLIITPVIGYAPGTTTEGNYHSDANTGMSIDYKITHSGGGPVSGITATEVKDRVDSDCPGWYRAMKGRLDSDITFIYVEGTASWNPQNVGFAESRDTSVKISVNAGNNPPPPQLLSIPAGGSETFKVSVPVDKFAKSVQVDINMTSGPHEDDTSGRPLQCTDYSVLQIGGYFERDSTNVARVANPGPDMTLDYKIMPLPGLFGGFQTTEKDEGNVRTVTGTLDRYGPTKIDVIVTASWTPKDQLSGDASVNVYVYAAPPGPNNGPPWWYKPPSKTVNVPNGHSVTFSLNEPAVIEQDPTNVLVKITMTSPAGEKLVVDGNFTRYHVAADSGDEGFWHGFLGALTLAHVIEVWTKFWMYGTEAGAIALTAAVIMHFVAEVLVEHRRR